MAFLKPYFDRRTGNGHAPPPPDANEAPVEARQLHVEAAPFDRLSEARARAQGLVAAEMEHLEDVFTEALKEAQDRLARTESDYAALRVKHEALERAHADVERKLRAVRELMGKLE